MKNLNPIYLLEISHKTVDNAINRTFNTLVKSGMSKKKASKKVTKRLGKMIDSRWDKILSVDKLPEELKNKTMKTPQYSALDRNFNTIGDFYQYYKKNLWK